MQSAGRNLLRLSLDKYLERTDQKRCLLTVVLVPSWPCIERQLYLFRLLSWLYGISLSRTFIDVQLRYSSSQFLWWLMDAFYHTENVFSFLVRLLDVDYDTHLTNLQLPSILIISHERMNSYEWSILAISYSMKMRVGFWNRDLSSWCYKDLFSNVCWSFGWGQNCTIVDWVEFYMDLHSQYILFE